MNRYRVSKLAGLIGEAAAIVVHKHAVTGKEKFASLHDLRRTFGHRWAPRVMPAILQELMRHESIETTLKYYTGQDAERAADVLWAAHEKAKASGPGVSSVVSGDSDDSENAQTP